MKKSNNKKNAALINDQIKAKQVRLIDHNQEQLGIVSITEAQRIAHDANLDLVMVSQGKDTPVCKIMDYSKYLYEQSKKLKEQRANQKQIIVKEIRVSPTIDVGDYQTKLKQATKFIQKGYKVQFSLRFKGRMITHSELGREILLRLIEDLGDSIIVEQKPKLDGRRMFVVVAPNTK